MLSDPSKPPFWERETGGPVTAWQRERAYLRALRLLSSNQAALVRIRTGLQEVVVDLKRAKKYRREKKHTERVGYWKTRVASLTQELLQFVALEDGAMQVAAACEKQVRELKLLRSAEGGGQKSLGGSNLTLSRRGYKLGSGNSWIIRHRPRSNG